VTLRDSCGAFATVADVVALVVKYEAKSVGVNVARKIETPAPIILAVAESMPLKEMTVEVSEEKEKTPGTLAVGVSVKSESPNALFIEPQVITGNAFPTVTVILEVAESND
jgi:hypothetical protein